MKKDIGEFDIQKKELVDGGVIEAWRLHLSLERTLGYQRPPAQLSSGLAYSFKFNIESQNNHRLHSEVLRMHKPQF